MPDSASIYLKEHKKTSISRNFLKYWSFKQITGIEPASSAWEADVLPMNYACIFYGNTVYYKSYFSKSKEIPVF